MKSQIVGVLKEVDVAAKVGVGVCPEHGLSSVKFHAEKSKYGGTEVS